ncbi:PMR5 N-terminal domain [Macleaya cordata]|uniref:PMR5 N-terminal domain n=1 Tax=Macleaya cordata TaxID=56857 RepID=A0A200Q7G8_MACCD|nr:PMR5 N-terminal domain [Macleaya cordata]
MGMKNQILLKSNPKFFRHLAAALTTLIILSLINQLNYPLLPYPSSLLKTTTSTSVLPSSSSSSPPRDVVEDLDVSLRSSSSSSDENSNLKCDLFAGKWVWDPENAPYYTNATCSAIHEQQNCMKYGKPNMDFTKWRWKPDDCELPIFNTEQFLEILRGKSLAFVGDSVARNQMESLICLLSKVGYPVDVSYSSQVQTKRLFYTNYNFTLSIFWSPYLVKTKETSTSGIFNVYLDEFDVDWTTEIAKFDYVIISAGHWFFRPSMFYENGELVGCLYCEDNNVTHFDHTYGYRRAIRTAFRAINSLEKLKGITFLRTFSPSHFENGTWNEGGNCGKTRPYMRNETHLNGQDLEKYTTQLEEFRVAEREGMKKGLNKFRLLDTSEAMWLRPDGHPSSYWHIPEEVGKYNDCVHWCSPGPVDTWNDFLLEMLKREEVRR